MSTAARAFAVSLAFVNVKTGGFAYSVAMMSPVMELTVLVCLAVGATWAATRSKAPSIVFLLLIGIAVGPGLRLVDPDTLFGDLLAPIVSMAVGFILFEGGMTLRFRELAEHKKLVSLLVTVGVIVTWSLGSLASWAILGLPAPIAIMLGAILVVSGPTVIAPILTSVRPARSVASILKWESIVIDPIGAMLAVLAFEIVLVGAEAPPTEILRSAAIFAVGGVATGLLVAWPSARAIRRHLMPERLVPIVAASAALVAFAVADLIAPEAGLLATTVLGLVLANSKNLRIEPIVRFSETLQPLLVGMLFIVLSARLTRQQIAEISWDVTWLVVILVLVARPLSVFISSWRSQLERKELAFLAALAPRGIVAAAVASVFSLELEHAGVPGASALTPITFAVIIATVLIYGFGAGPFARWLGLAQQSNQGVLIAGAGMVERAVGEALADAGFRVLFASTDRREEASARLSGYATYYGNLIDHDLPLDLDLSGIGKILAISQNDEANTLLARRFAELFGASDSYQIEAASLGPGISTTSADLGGRILFGPEMSYEVLLERLNDGQKIRSTTLSETFLLTDLEAKLDSVDDILFLVRGDQLLVGATDEPRPLSDQSEIGDTLLWLSNSRELASNQNEDARQLP